MLIHTAIYKKYAALTDYENFVEQQLSVIRTKFPNVRLHSFAEFKNFLDKVIPKLIHKYMLRAGAMKVCSTISPDFSEIASAAGFAVIVQHVSGHVRNIALTTDGPYLVDLSYIQFLCQHDLMDPDVKQEALKAYRSLYKDPFKAVKVELMSKEHFQGVSVPEAKYENDIYDPVKRFDKYDMEEEEELFPERFNRFKS